MRCLPYLSLVLALLLAGCGSASPAPAPDSEPQTLTVFAAASLSDAFNEIGQLVKKTRDETFVEKDEQGYTVNRCEGIGWTGGCTDTNELNYLAVKTMRSLGVCYFETQARV